MASTVCHESISNLEKLNKEKIRGLLIPPPHGSQMQLLGSCRFLFCFVFLPPDRLFAGGEQMCNSFKKLLVHAGRTKGFFLEVLLWST